MREALLLGEVEQDPGVARERRAVVEHERGLAAQPREEHVPHHPVGGAVVEEPVPRPHVEVQLEGLERLEQRAARAMHDARDLDDVALEHAERVIALPGHHSDPFDRMLVAQARIDGFALVTRDPQFAAYDVEIVSC